MNYVLLQFMFDGGLVLSYAVESQAADLVVKQFGAGQLPGVLDNNKVRCREGVPWAMATKDLRLVTIGGSAPTLQVMQQQQSQPQPGFAFDPLGGRR